MRATRSSSYQRSGFLPGEAEMYSLILSCQLACWRFWMGGLALTWPMGSELRATRLF